MVLVLVTYVDRVPEKKRNLGPTQDEPVLGTLQDEGEDCVGLAARLRKILRTWDINVGRTRGRPAGHQKFKGHAL